MGIRLMLGREAESLVGGWITEEALAIASYSVLALPDDYVKPKLVLGADRKEMLMAA